MAQIEFRYIPWKELSVFLDEQTALARHDLDHMARWIQPEMYIHSRVEGFYLNNALVGFARWDARQEHLCSIYVTPAARGYGITSKFLRERPLRSLQVMPENHAAIALYERHGFQIRPANIPSRYLMVRDLVRAA